MASKDLAKRELYSKGIAIYPGSDSKSQKQASTSGNLMQVGVYRRFVGTGTLKQAF